jgi:hypothetical protein
MKWNIGKLRKMYDAKDEIFCMRDFDFMRKKFEDDPDAIGKWRLMGEVADFGDIEPRQTGCHANETLYFLPGGEFYWCFYWSRGILYHMYSSYNVVLPNKYIIEERGGTRYMFVEWLCSKFRDGYEEAAILLYKQEDTMRYTEKETRLCHDDVFLPYVPDDSVIGVWEVYDYIRDISDFSSDKRTYQGRLAYKSIEFFPRGVCRRWYPRYSSHMYYTKGFILDREQELSIAYFIREAEGEAYLFTEHKSGDYMYDGKIYGYYIFKKKKEQ